MNTPPTQRRKHPRVLIKAHSWVRYGMQTVYLRVRDLSRGGIGLVTPMPFYPAGEVEFEIEFPGGRAMVARGEVMWAQTQPDLRIGARFTKIIKGQDVLESLTEPGD